MLAIRSRQQCGLFLKQSFAWMVIRFTVLDRTECTYRMTRSVCDRVNSNSKNFQNFYNSFALDHIQMLNLKIKCEGYYCIFLEKMQQLIYSLFIVIFKASMYCHYKNFIVVYLIRDLVLFPNKRKYIGYRPKNKLKNIGISAKIQYRASLMLTIQLCHLRNKLHFII